MKNFLEYTYQIVRKSLERYLYQVQQKENVKHEEQKIQEINKKKHQDELNGGSKLRSILRDSKTNSKKLPMIDGLYSFFPSNIDLPFPNRITLNTFAHDFSIQ